MKDRELSPKELEVEHELHALASSLDPSPEFTARMERRLTRHHALIDTGARKFDHESAHLRGNLFSRITTKAYVLIVAFVFVIFTGGVTTFAYTDDSVTNGSLLYPVKRGIEKIESRLQFTPKASAEFRVKLVRRRLAESRHLSLRGVASSVVAAEVSRAVTDSIEVIQNLPETSERNTLLSRVTTLLHDEEDLYAEVSGASAARAETDENRRQKNEEKRPQEKLKKKDMSRPTREISQPVAAPAAMPSTTPSEKSLAPIGDTLEEIALPKPPPVTEEAPRIVPPAYQTSGKSSLRENVPVPLNLETKVLDAIQQNREHLKNIEKRLEKVRGEK
jgi:hypothetical protein